MPYTDRAKELRRCTDRRADGEPCRAWAVWDDPRQRCMSHSGRHHRGRVGLKPKASERTCFKPCMCAAYQWPHRPGGGVCCWPDPPRLRLMTPAGTHAWPRLSPKWKQLARIIERRRRREERERRMRQNETART